MKEREARREIILTAALSVFRKKGLEGATMDEIGREGGFGKGSLYYYFDSKEAIFDEILKRGWRNLWEGVDEPLQKDGCPKDIFFHKINRILEIIFENRNLYDFLFVAPRIQDRSSVTKSLLEIEPEWKVYQKKLYGTLRSLLEEGMERGEFTKANPDLLFQAIGGLIHGLLFLGNKTRDGVHREEMEEILTGLLAK
jgi:AcrR family transcriptional regulator